jgi:hypothetical protein
LYINEHKLKYILQDSDFEYLKKYSTSVDIFKIKFKKNCIFYTTFPWSLQTNNYIKYNEKYYIIEPGYYYYINENTELFLEHNYKINVLHEEKLIVQKNNKLVKKNK